MPNTSDQYKRQVMKNLAGGNKETLPDDSENFADFDNFAQRSSRKKRRNLFSDFFQPDHISSTQLEPELQQALARIQPSQRDDIARELFSHLKKRGLSDRDLEK